MNLTSEDKRLLEELCQQHAVSADKVLKLLDTVHTTTNSRSAASGSMRPCARF
ncbi:hypothetical protein [Desulfobulbus propionicus]